MNLRSEKGSNVSEIIYSVEHLMRLKGLGKANGQIRKLEELFLALFTVGETAKFPALLVF